MNLFDLITTNKKLITVLYRAGYINPSAMLHYEIYKYYSDWRRLDVDKKTAIETTALYFNITSRTVYNSIKKMESES